MHTAQPALNLSDRTQLSSDGSTHVDVGHAQHVHHPARQAVVDYPGEYVQQLVLLRIPEVLLAPSNRLTYELVILEGWKATL